MVQRTYQAMPLTMNNLPERLADSCRVSEAAQGITLAASRVPDNPETSNSCMEPSEKDVVEVSNKLDFYAKYLERVNDNKRLPGFLTVEGLVAFNVLGVGQQLVFKNKKTTIDITVRTAPKVVLFAQDKQSETPTGLLRKLMGKPVTGAWRRIRTSEGESLETMHEAFQRRTVDGIFSEIEKLTPTPFEIGADHRDGMFRIVVKTEMPPQELDKARRSNALLNSKYVEIKYGINPPAQLDRGPRGVAEGAGIFHNGLVVGTAGTFLCNYRDPNQIFCLTAAHTYAAVLPGGYLQISHPFYISKSQNCTASPHPKFNGIENDIGLALIEPDSIQKFGIPSVAVNIDCTILSELSDLIDGEEGIHDSDSEDDGFDNEIEGDDDDRDGDDNDDDDDGEHVEDYRDPSLTYKGSALRE